MAEWFFDRFSLRMPLDVAHSCAHPGLCDSDVAIAVARTEIAEQLNAIGPDRIRAELREYGAWDEVKLADDVQNQQRIVWIAAGNIAADA